MAEKSKSGKASATELIQILGERGEGGIDFINGAEAKLFETLGLASFSNADTETPTPSLTCGVQQPAAFGLSNVPFELPADLGGKFADPAYRQEKIDELLDDFDKQKSDALQTLHALESSIMGEPQYILPASQQLDELTTALSSTTIGFRTNNADELNQYMFKQPNGTVMADKIETRIMMNAKQKHEQSTVSSQNRSVEDIIDKEHLKRIAPGISGGLNDNDFAIRTCMQNQERASEATLAIMTNVTKNMQSNTRDDDESKDRSQSVLTREAMNTRIAQDPEYADQVRNDVLRRRQMQAAGFDEQSVKSNSSGQDRDAQGSSSPENVAINSEKTLNGLTITSIFDYVFSDNDDDDSDDANDDANVSDEINRNTINDTLNNEVEDGDKYETSTNQLRTDTRLKNPIISQNTSVDVETKETENFAVDIATGATEVAAMGMNVGIVSPPKTSSEAVASIDGLFNRNSNKTGNGNDEYSFAVTKRVDVSKFHQLIPEMAWNFAFELDVFQKEAVIHLERGESVFIAAHTSAGKTVVAEYAIALCKHHMTKCVYTSPIKALSNQKYRDFQKRFDDIGLITGDTQINPEASCLIMTTEILRSMLYRGSDLIRDIEWVIFDEVHYINDAERGVVWEEVIIMLPEHINLVFLSATTPNTVEFSDWIGRTKRRPVYVISTSHRPVPLTHYIYTGINGKDKLHQIVGDNGRFDASGYKKACEPAPAAAAKAISKRPTGRGGGGSRGRAKGGGKKGRGGGATIKSFIQMIQKRELLPMVIFAFSKRKCESGAQGLQGLSLNTKTEQSHALSFCNRALARLQGSDRQLPQVLTIIDQAKRGIGVHHGGLLPILKEIVEILFCEGLIKVLFATETFAMGVNAPAKAVAFSSVRKFDGKKFRTLLPGEYTQMSGRAGRRGLDTTGTVVILAINDDVPERDDLAKMLTGKPTALESQFRLTYTMILNLLKVEDMSVEGMIKKSFSEVHTARAMKVKDPEEFLAKLEASRGKLPEIDNIEEHEAVTDIVELESQMLKSRSYLHAHLMRNTKLFCGGRVVVLSLTENLTSLMPKRSLENKANETTCGYLPNVGRTLLALLLSAPSWSSGRLKVLALCPHALALHLEHRASPCEFITHRDTSSGRLGLLVEVPVAQLAMICKAKAKHVQPRIYDSPEENDAAFSKAMDTLINVEAQCGGFPVASTQMRHPEEVNFSQCLGRQINIDLGLAIRNLRSLSHEMDQIVKTDLISGTPFNRLSKILSTEIKRRALDQRIDALKNLFSSEALRLFPDFQQRLKVLSRLEYINEEQAVQLKGRVASEVNTCDELIMTELVFENVLAELDPSECVALLSAFIFKKKTDDDPMDGLSEGLTRAVEATIDICHKLADVQQDCNLDILVDEYQRETLNFGLVRVVYEWARGMPFCDICLLTSVEEGTIVRAITRVDETCREVRNAARIIGDPALYRKMEAASALIKRDIVFATSLYLS